MLSAGIEDRTWEEEVGGGDCGSAAGVTGACSVQDWKNVFCFGDVGAVEHDELVAVAKNAMRVKKGAEKIRVKEGLKKNEEDELGALRFRIARDF